MAIAGTSRPWRMLAPLAAVIVLFALWSAFWLWGAARAGEEVAGARGELARHGLLTACAGERHGGYPFRFSFTCTGLRLDGADGSAGEATALRVLAQAWDPGHLLFVLDGPLILTRPDGGTWRIEHTSAVASLVIRRSELRASLLVEGLTGRGPMGERLAAGRLNLHARLTGDDTARPAAEFAAVATALDVRVNGLDAGPIDDVSAEATLTGLPRTAAAGVREFLRRAAAAGTELKISRGSAVAGEVNLEVSGAVALEAAGFPAGRIAMRFSDPRRFLAQLAERGMLTAKTASTAGALVGLLTGSASSTGRPGAIDLVFKDGSVFWGPFRLASHGPLF